MKQETILSGVQATGRMHIGNYLGALKQFVDIQNEGKLQCYFFVADLHALTVPRDPKQLRQDTLEVVAEYIAAGLDPEKSVIFIQNHVLEHAELAWIFNCITPVGELERMTQFKDKGKNQKDSVNAGLLTYPTLMAADILMYKPNFVPVGDDQVQHIELSRVVARKFNKQFGETFPEPKPFVKKPLRIMSLKNPDTKKMSKTGDDPIYMDDEPAVIHAKLKKAVTATGAEGSAGVENLLYLLETFGSPATAGEFRAQVKDGSIKYSELKTSLADAIADYFADFRKKKKELLADKQRLAQILADGAARAREIAHPTMLDVKQKVGLL
ncbi:MAG TPA: tryptophan--tRNA ligase [Patescibacteria group bacterium]|jgi:tryptophanyl-tRNA synthetase|nr:tryptophan--tRNA ligase [Patescibacteria group bacterium]